MVITRIGTESLSSWTLDASIHSFSHTVPSTTSLLLLIAGVQASNAVTGNVQWDGNTMTLVDQTTPGGSADCTIFTYGLISPTPATGTALIDWISNSACSWCVMINFAGTVTTSVAAATNFLAEDVDDAGAASTAVFGSAGSSPNSLIVSTCGVGDDSSPMSNGSSFTEIFDGNTGGGAGNINDMGYNIAELLNGAPSAVTITLGATDEHAAQYIELVAAVSSSIAPIAMHHMRQMD